MGEFSSSPAPLTCGAPQRSICGPLVLRLDLIIGTPCTLDLIIWLFPINCSSKILLQDCWQTADRISPILASLYWQPRIDFKILNLINYFQSPSCPCTTFLSLHYSKIYSHLMRPATVCVPQVTPCLVLLRPALFQKAFQFVPHGSGYPCRKIFGQLTQ